MTLGVLALLAAIACSGYCIQTITGFGAVVFGVAVGANVTDIHTLVLLLLPLSILQCGYVVVRYRGQINRPLLVRWIMPVMGVGTAVGAVLASRVGGAVLRNILAVVILLLSVREVGARLRWWSAGARTLGRLGTGIGLALAGVMHGLYASGGPLLVYTVGRSPIDKSALRTTLNVVWLVMNLALVTSFAVRGQYGEATVTHVAYLVPAMVVGVAAGDRLHDRIDGERLRLATFAMLALASLALLLR